MSYKTTQFRIGNHVRAKHPDAKFYGTAIKLTHDHMKMLCRENPGITLSPAKLHLKFLKNHGFKKDIALTPFSIQGSNRELMNMFKKGNLSIQHVSDSEFIFHPMNSNPVQIKYEHEVQNLFLILNGQEL